MESKKQEVIDWRMISEKYPKAFDEFIKFLYKEKYPNYIKDNHFIGAVFNYLENRFPFRDCLDFFDSKGIYICPRVDLNDEFRVEIGISREPACTVIDYGTLSFKSRYDAEVNGFIFSMTFLESKLANDI